jgi:hypothetical protein
MISYGKSFVQRGSCTGTPGFADLAAFSVPVGPVVTALRSGLNVRWSPRCR